MPEGSDIEFAWAGVESAEAEMRRGCLQAPILSSRGKARRGCRSRDALRVLEDDRDDDNDDEDDVDNNDDDDDDDDCWC